jgi:hypothetical protein
LEPSAVIDLKSQYKLGFGLFWSLALVGLIACFSFLGSFVILVIPGVVVAVYATMYITSVVIDGKRGFSAFTESYSLVKGRWWGVFGRMLFFSVVIGIPYLVLFFLVSLALMALGVDSHSASGNSISSLISLAISASITPLAYSYIYKLYMSLKATRQAEVSTVAFKRWMIAFTIIGPIAFFLIIASTISLAVLNGYRQAAEARSAAQNMSPNNY